MTLYEYEPHALTGEWRPLDKTTWLSWSGRRRLNGREYHGPIFYLGSKKKVDRQARVCPCDVCQQTNPWKVEVLAERPRWHAAQAEVARLTRERDAALGVLANTADALEEVEGHVGAYLWEKHGYGVQVEVARQTIVSIESGAIHGQ